MKLIIGAPQIIIPIVTSTNKPCLLYNIGSMMMLNGVQMLSNLVPSSSNFSLSNMIIDERDFDIKYANYLLNDDRAFIDMMNIAYNLYLGNDVFCFADIDEYKENYLESILKFFQGRYGFNGQILGEVEDYEYTEDSTFSINGLFNIDIDKERFTSLCQNYMN